MTAEEIIKKLNLVPLPEEGGFYTETFREKTFIPEEALPEHEGKRCYSTAIYYLVTPEEFSALHRVKSTEIFHFYAGDPVEMVQIDKQGKLEKIVIGNNFEREHRPQVIVEPGVWQGVRLAEGGEWSLMGCTVASGFEFEDFEVESYEKLSAQYPQHKDVIREYTR